MKARFISLAVVVLIIAGLIGYALASGLSMLYWLVLGSPLIALLLLAIWYGIWGWGDLRRRLQVSASLVLLLFLIIAGIGFLTRYEGSTSGASLPKLVWKWSEKDTTQGPANTTVNPAVDPQTIEADAAAAETNFLGPNRDGMWPSADFSLDWATDPPVELWRRPVGAGWSSFAVAKGRAITLEQIGDDEQVTCLDLLTGKEIWKQTDAGVNFVKSKEGAPGATMGGEGPRSTPTVFGDKVYVTGSTGIAKCLDFDSGKLIWSRNVITDYQGTIPKWGKSNAPLVLAEEKLVIFTGGETAGVNTIALDLETGEPKWTSTGQGASYSSPRLLTLLGIRQIVTVNQHDANGLDPATGKELWRFEWKGGLPKVGQPLPVSENRILLTASYGVGSPLIELKKNGAAWSVTQVWRSTRMKTKFSSAAILGEHVYGLDEGMLAAIDLETGNKVWKREKYGFGQHLLVGDHLIVQTEAGDLVLGTPTPQEFIEKARIKALSSMTWNVPSLAGRFLLVRNDREAICFLLPKKE